VQSSYTFTVASAVFDGLLAHIPSGLFGANCAWLACAVIAHNLPATGTLAGGEQTVTRFKHRGQNLERGNAPNGNAFILRDAVTTHAAGGSNPNAPRQSLPS
jgi:hypothetical protein